MLDTKVNLARTCYDIYPGRVELTSPIELAVPLIQAGQAEWPFAWRTIHIRRSVVRSGIPGFYGMDLLTAHVGRVLSLAVMCEIEAV